ncbi:hypothetical protein GIB67_022863 [Kingdonia uniflora]|uniref:Reverse transcriptase zinc-binding domain-containing protein n=1 Tax=Kingdonia uniflora TaxID=39325 RepID=A0A7J7P7D0_9MAGN|nr:hypothetical protein GIB67_022863 [Kingdonia uniflora]
MNIRKKQKARELFGYSEGLLLEKYLRISLIKGRVKKATTMPLVEILKKRASTWAGSLLSMQGRVVLIQYVLRSLSVYNMGIYKWPISVIQEGERCIWNFLWSRSSETRKACTVSWEKVCKQRNEGRLGIRKLKDINLSLLMKLAWKFLEGGDDWAKFIRAKFTARNGDLYTYFRGSSVWAGLKWAMPMVKQHTGWIAGDGKDIDLWRDNWCALESIKELVDNKNIPWKQMKAKVSCIITNGKWTAPQDLLTVLTRLNIELGSIKIYRGRRDQKIWEPNLQGKFSMQSAHEMVRQKGAKQWWTKYLYGEAVHPRNALWGWRLYNNAIPTDDNEKKKGIDIASRCRMCEEAEESMHHLYWGCKVSVALWQWSMNMFQIHCHSLDLKAMIKATDNKSSYIKDL